MKYILILITLITGLNNYAQTAEDYFKSGTTKFNAEDFKGAMQDCNKVIELNPKHDKAYFLRGNSKSKLEDYRGAIQDFNKVVELKPQHNQIYFYRGLAKSNLEDYSGAIQDFTKAIQINPKYAEAYYWRGMTKIPLSYKTGVNDIDGICLDFSKAGELGNQDAYEAIKKVCNGNSAKDKENAETYFNQGVTKGRVKDYKGAIEDFTKAIELNPKYAEAFYRRGLSKALLDDKEGSCLDWKKAVELGNSDAYDVLKQYCK